jgi:hypothetical protein
MELEVQFITAYLSWLEGYSIFLNEKSSSSNHNVFPICLACEDTATFCHTNIFGKIT